MNLKLSLYNVFAFFALLSCAYAQNWALWLEDIKILADTDTFGDQIYFFVLQKNNTVPTAYFSLPDFPFSYTEENLASFQPGILWEGEITPESDVSLVLSLVDREALPWIADEVLGNLDVSIAPKNQGLAIQWTSLTPSVTFDANQSSPLSQRVHVEQNGGKYSFDLTWKAVDHAA